MRLGLKEICEVPAMENGFDDHIGTINGHKTPELGKIFQEFWKILIKTYKNCRNRRSFK